jgi:Bacterial PH domain
MATLRYEPRRRWRWLSRALPRRAARRGDIEAYQAPNECVLCVTGPHPVTLAPTVVIWLGVTFGLATGISPAVIPPATLFLAWRVWRWRVAQYVLTNQRLLYVDGIVYMRVSALPLSSVLDTTCWRSVAGRLFGYGDVMLIVNLCGQPELRTLTRLSRPEMLYASILNLTAVRDVTETP